jgi:deazaflavin-dependent oxidoreductase (nitroreductase family)
MSKPVSTEDSQNVPSVQGDDASMPESQPRPQSQPQLPSHYTVLRLTRVPGMARFVNLLVLKLAGRRLLPLYGVIEHRGRRSGKAYRTPVYMEPTSDGFVAPMIFGESADWYRNVKAAGECTIRWKGRDYEMTQPELIAPAAARERFGGTGIIRASLTHILRVNYYVHLRHRV